ncbi:MAG: glycosyltransferase [Chloroflexi bacterium]|uniref:glycosyltransferase n=1 Tax=Candidatus Flexifilum breve TaxID=3140694 RepID=UPI0031365FF1|nr:glycosyltransferase [Chloroflexota bacterium]
MSSSPLVTVITPTYNRADYLPSVIDSVLAQDYTQLEYIILDDGSTDNTESVLKRYGMRIQWESQPNMGEGRTVNKGWKLARGEFIAVVNSDDPVMPGWLSTMVHYMQTHPEVLVAYPDWVMIDAQDQPIQTIFTYDYSYANMIRWHHCFPGPGVLIRRSAFEMEPERDTSFRYVGDYEYWMRLGLHGPFGRVNQALATFRFHQGSASLAAKGLMMAQEHIAMLDKFFQRSDIPRSIRELRREAYSAANYIAAIQCMSERQSAARYFIRSLLLHPRSKPNGLSRSADLMAQFILTPKLYALARRSLDYLSPVRQKQPA